MGRYTSTYEQIQTMLEDRGWDYFKVLTLYYILESISYTQQLNKYGRLIKSIRYNKVHKYYAPTRKT